MMGIIDQGRKKTYQPEPFMDQAKQAIEDTCVMQCNFR